MQHVLSDTVSSRQIINTGPRSFSSGDPPPPHYKLGPYWSRWYMVFGHSNLSISSFVRSGHWSNLLQMEADLVGPNPVFFCYYLSNYCVLKMERVIGAD